MRGCLFKALDIDVIKLIVEKFINELNGQIAEKRVLVRLSRSGSRDGWQRMVSMPDMARGRWSRLIHEKIKQPLANEILFGKLEQAAAALSSKRTTTNCY